MKYLASKTPPARVGSIEVRPIREAVAQARSRQPKTIS
jgi:hypothetical protein